MGRFRTDFFYRTYELEPEGRWHYRFLVDFEDPQPDPRNPAQALGESEVLSELVMLKFQDPDWLKSEALACAGRLERITVESKACGESFEVQVYLPAGYDGHKTFPLWVLPNGEQWLEAGINKSFRPAFQ